MRMTQKRLKSGERLPWGYGLAYYEDLYMEAVCYPLPLNWIVWACRQVYFVLIVTPRGMDSRISEAYHRGVAEGRSIGLSRGYVSGFEAAQSLKQYSGSSMKSPPLVRDDSNHPLNRLARGERL